MEGMTLHRSRTTASFLASRVYFDGTAWFGVLSVAGSVEEPELPGSEAEAGTITGDPRRSIASSFMIPIKVKAHSFANVRMPSKSSAVVYVRQISMSNLHVEIDDIPSRLLALLLTNFCQTSMISC